MADNLKKADIEAINALFAQNPLRMDEAYAPLEVIEAMRGTQPADPSQQAPGGADRSPQNRSPDLG